MAMLQLGKLKFRYKDGGVDFRWGDGDVKRLGKKISAEAVEDYADNYSEYDDDADLSYDGRFADEADYAEDDYADDGYGDYAEDDYADDGYGDYAEDDYADDGYADEDDYGYSDEEDDQYGDYDDGGDSYGDYADDDYPEEDYDDGYGYDDQYDDYEEEYDDRYSDEDADDESYIGGDYEGYDGEYDYDDGYAEGGLNGLLQYVDENDWVTYLLLVLLPPLGIYLLWRRQRFEPMVRYAVSAASAVWFVVMIVLLVTLVFGGQDDATNPPQVPTLAPTVAASAAPSATPTVAPNSTANLTMGLSPAATPIGGAPTASILQGNIVWTSASGSFYHNNNECEKATGETLTQTTLDNAKNRGKYACPTCYGGQVYYARPDGDYYHLVKDCSGMKSAIEYTKERAEAEKKQACPVCVTKTQTELGENAGNAKLTFVTSSTKDKSGIKVWCTSGGVNYHMTSGCRGMSGAKQVTLSEALQMGKTACKTCCAVSGETVYCTKNGTYYHRNDSCSGMKSASAVTIAEALVLGKKECPTCRPVANNSTTDTSTNANNTASSETTTEEYYVYATSGGKYYHVKKNCTGMSGAKRVTLASMVAEGRPACPECCGGAAMSVYASKGGTYYHSYATCSGMSNAKQGTLVEALANGYKRCPRCWGDSDTTTSQENTSSETSPEKATANSVMVYATKNGKWYHTKSNCTGMSGARYITLSQAMDEGKTACPTCATTANKVVYSTNTGKYYHAAETCDNMKGASKRTLAEALKKGQTACPICMVEKPKTETEEETGNENDTPVKMPEKVANFTVGKSGIKVYASPTEKYYHAKSTCSNADEMEHVALETALNYGRKPCSKCLSTADDTVYATKNGKYYHVSKSCAGSGAAKGTLAEALAYGFSPCPYCVTGEKTESPSTPDEKYESGRSGIQVYAKADGTYYHATKSCAGSGAVKVTLETALNYGMKACQDCLAVADRTVYAVRGTLYYHASKDCAGSGAVKGNYAQALAYGLSACPNCIGGGAAGTPSSPAPSEAPEYTAPAESSVYVDLYADHFYYHKSSKCSGSGMSGGTEVTLEYAKDFGYERCPYCNPASGID